MFNRSAAHGLREKSAPVVGRIRAALVEPLEGRRTAVGRAARPRRRGHRAGPRVRRDRQRTVPVPQLAGVERPVLQQRPRRDPPERAEHARAVLRLDAGSHRQQPRLLLRRPEPGKEPVRRRPELRRLFRKPSGRRLAGHTGRRLAVPRPLHPQPQRDGAVHRRRHADQRRRRGPNSAVNRTFGAFKAIPTTDYSSLPTVSYIVPNNLHSTHGSNEAYPWAGSPDEQNNNILRRAARRLAARQPRPLPPVGQGPQQPADRHAGRGALDRRHRPDRDDARQRRPRPVRSRHQPVVRQPLQRAAHDRGRCTACPC